jgi:hypothetical protein
VEWWLQMAWTENPPIKDALSPHLRHICSTPTALFSVVAENHTNQGSRTVFPVRILGSSVERRAGGPRAVRHGPQSFGRRSKSHQHHSSRAPVSTADFITGQGARRTAVPRCTIRLGWPLERAGVWQGKRVFFDDPESVGIDARSDACIGLHI